jgi:hypothetical protein
VTLNLLLWLFYQRTSVSVLWGKFFQSHKFPWGGEVPRISGTLTHLRLPDPLWLRSLYQTYFLYFISHKNSDWILVTWLIFTRNPVTSNSSDFVKFSKHAQGCGGITLQNLRYSAEHGIRSSPFSFSSLFLLCQPYPSCK